MTGAADPHPRDVEGGMVFWKRDSTLYVVGDRVRGTVLLVLPGAVVELMPETARFLAGEMAHHAADCMAQSPSETDHQPAKGG